MGNLTAPSTSGQFQTDLETLLNGPASPPPAGVQPNFENPPNLDTIIYITKTMALTLTTLAVFIGIYTRHVLLHSMGYDDYTSVVSWLGLIGYLTVSLLGVKAGAGVHMWDLRLSAFFGLLYWINIVVIVYDPVNVFVKVSILLQYSRIFNPTGKKYLPMSISIQICIWSILLFYLLEFFFNIFQCHPREYIWNKLGITGYCYSREVIDKASALFNVVSDFAILIFPISSIWRLQMCLRRKLLISGVFAIGFLACVMSIIRTYYSWQFYESSDKSYKIAVFGLWGDAEFAIGIIIGCFPVMPRFFQHVGPKVSEALLFRPKPTSNASHGPRARSKTSKTDAAGKSKNPFAKYRVGSGIFESYGDPYAQPHGEYYTLDELESSRGQRETTSPPSQAPGMGIATRRDDLEYGHREL